MQRIKILEIQIGSTQNVSKVQISRKKPLRLYLVLFGGMFSIGEGERGQVLKTLTHHACEDERDRGEQWDQPIY